MAPLAPMTGEPNAANDVKEAKAPPSTKVMDKLADIERSLNVKRGHIPGSGNALYWIQGHVAQSIFGAAIMANAIFMGVDIEFGGEGFNLPFWIIETLFLVIFFVECFLRIKAERPHYRKFFDQWGCFDLAVTTVGAVDTWFFTLIVSNSDDSPLGGFAVLRVFRLVRLVRLIRVLRMFSELVMLVNTLADSIKAVGWMCLLLLMITYTGSIITVLLLGQPYGAEDPLIEENFGSLGSALFSHFCIVTVENWPEVAEPAMEKSWAWGVYFVVMIMLTNFALINLMVGVIVERIIESSLEQEAELNAFVAESNQFEKTLRLIWEQADLAGDGSGETSLDEVRQVLKRVETKEIFMAFGISLSMPEQMLHVIMNLEGEESDRKHKLKFEDFFDACLRLCGSKWSIHSLYVQHDINAARKNIVHRMDEVKKKMPRVAAGYPMQLPAPRPRPLPASAEAACRHLVERLDQLSDVQGRIVDELQQYRERARYQGYYRDNTKDPAPSACASVKQAVTLPCELVSRPAKDMSGATGACCIDSWFTRTTEKVQPANRSSSADACMTRPKRPA